MTSAYPPPQVQRRPAVPAGKRACSTVTRAMVLCVSAWLAPGLAARADEPTVSMTKPAPGTGPAALPRIINPGDDAGRRINAALNRADARLRAAAAACSDSAGQDATWNRSVTLPMTGPGYLSILIADSLMCGGAHPDADVFALVYDLRNGTPVNWGRLLPADVAGTMTLDDAADGSKIGTVNSAKLHAVYAGHYPSTKDRAACLEAVADAAFILWPDAEAAGLVIRPEGLPYAVQACAEPVVIPLAALGALGAAPTLTDAIEAAHQRR